MVDGGVDDIKKVMSSASKKFPQRRSKPVVSLTFCPQQLIDLDVTNSVSSVVEFPGAGSSRLRTINSELNGAT